MGQTGGPQRPNYHYADPPVSTTSQRPRAVRTSTRHISGCRGSARREALATLHQLKPHRSAWPLFTFRLGRRRKKNAARCGAMRRRKRTSSAIKVVELRESHMHQPTPRRARLCWRSRTTDSRTSRIPPGKRMVFSAIRAVSR